MVSFHGVWRYASGGEGIRGHSLSLEVMFFGPSLWVWVAWLVGRDSVSTFSVGKTLSLPLFKALMIAALAELVVGSAGIAGGLAFFDTSNEREWAEYSLDSRS